MNRFLFIFLIILVFESNACCRANGSSGNKSQEVIIAATPDDASPKDLDEPINKQDENKLDDARQPIRKIDFKNFTFPWFPLYPTEKKSVVIKKKIVLRKGKNEIHAFPALRYGGPETEFYEEYLGNVSYFDLTRDRKAEAIVTVAVDMHRWVYKCIFVYQEEKGKVKLLWKYELNALNFQSASFLMWRGHKVINNNLVIEEYPIRFDEVDKCSKQYFRKTYSWNGKAFQEKSSETVPFDEDKKCRAFTGYPSESPPAGANGI